MLYASVAHDIYVKQHMFLLVYALEDEKSATLSLPLLSTKPIKEQYYRP
jgi:hypothetical protein